MTQRVKLAITPDSISHDTVECLEQLLEQAKAGTAIGIAYVVMYRRRRYAADTAGEAFRNPTFARGMVRALDDQLSERVKYG